jgi:nitric oxide reductase subunit B
VALHHRGLTFLSGILGTGHHYYYIGTPKYWLMIGGIFSALEPLAFLGMAFYAIAMAARAVGRHPNKIALTWTLGCAVMSFVGAGFLGFAHTLPQVNMWTHGTLVTAMHGHLAFWGAYAMLVLAMIAYALPQMTGRGPLRWLDPRLGSFWTSNIGMVAMTGAFAVAGVAQVYLERMWGWTSWMCRKPSTCTSWVWCWRRRSSAWASCATASRSRSTAARR